MRIRCWGSRGSIPVSGIEYVTHGGDTTCVEIRSSSDDIIIIDSGTGIRRLGIELLREKRHDLNIIYTHAHWDHILGFPFFKPIYFSETKIHIYGCTLAQKSIKDILAMSMNPPFFPVDLASVKSQINFSNLCGIDFTIGSVQISPIPLSHPNMGFGYKFIENGKTFVFLTDNELEFQHPKGLVYEDYVEFCRGADLLVHDSEFSDEEYLRTRTWGHSRYLKALALAIDAGVSRFGLCHHNQERSNEALKIILQECQHIAAEAGSPVECFAMTQDTDIVL